MAQQQLRSGWILKCVGKKQEYLSKENRRIPPPLSFPAPGCSHLCCISMLVPIFFFVVFVPGVSQLSVQISKRQRLVSGRSNGSAFQVQLLCNPTLFCAVPSLPSNSGKRLAWGLAGLGRRQGSGTQGRDGRRCLC